MLGCVSTTHGVKRTIALNPGTVSAIYIGGTKSGPLTSVNSVRGISGQGLEGDRYFQGSATPPDKRKPDTEITLIEVEAIEALAREESISLEPSDCRRNVVTRGVALNHLVGRKFRVGAATLEGIRLCEPCRHLEKMTQPGVIKGLTHRGGLRAAILVDGEIRVGDVVDVP